MSGGLVGTYVRDTCGERVGRVVVAIIILAVGGYHVVKQLLELGYL